MTGRALSNWRRRMGLTQREAAGRLDISVSYLQKMERGEAPIARRTELACIALENGMGNLELGK